jgi:hypothetical protein
MVPGAANRLRYGMELCAATRCTGRVRALLGTDVRARPRLGAGNHALLLGRICGSDQGFDELDRSLLGIRHRPPDREPVRRRVVQSRKRG